MHLNDNLSFKILVDIILSINYTNNKLSQNLKQISDEKIVLTFICRKDSYICRD